MPPPNVTHAGQTGPATLNNSGPSIPDNSAAKDIQASDVISFTIDYGSSDLLGPMAFVLNETLIFPADLQATAGPDLDNPATPYPFSRLAWSNSTSPSATFIYHQLSDSIIAEDAWFTTGGWHYSNISIGLGT